MKGELKIEPEAETEVESAESVIEYDDPRMTEFVEKYGKRKAKILITIPESMLEGIPEEQIKKMDLKTTKGLKQALEEEITEDDVSEDAPEAEKVPEPEPEDESEEEFNNQLITELDIDYEAEPDGAPEDESDSEE